MEEEDVFEDAREELVEVPDTALHEAVFRNDLPEISALLRAAKEQGRGEVVSRKDHQGNTGSLAHHYMQLDRFFLFF